MPAHRTQNTRHLRVEAAPSLGAPPINIISPTPRAFVFPATESNTTNADVSSYTYTSQFHASHSLPNLFAFESSSHNGADSSWTDAQSSTGSQTSMFSSYTDSPSSFTGSSFASPANSLYGSSYTSSPPDSSSTPPLSLSPSPPPPSGSSADGEHQLTSSSPAPYPHPLPPHSNGQVRTQPPRPPNPWICFRNVRSAQYKSTGEFPKLEKKARGCSAPSSPAAGPIGLDGEARRPRQADLSKHISLEWKALTDEEKAPYVRMSEEAKIVHARVYPGYKYQPRRKLDGVDSKKNAKVKKAGKKSSKSARKPSATAEQQFSGGAIAIQFPPLDADITPQGQDDNGEQSKEWTWLPDQTLLPFTWDIDPEGSAAMDDVMHQLDANVDEQGEENEDVFREPFYLSFPPLDPASDASQPFFPFQDLQGEPASFADPNYNFPNSSALGLQTDFLEDHSGVPESFEHVAPPSFEPGLRRDSLVNPHPEVSSESTEANAELSSPAHDASDAQPQTFIQDMFTSLPQFTNRAPRHARRGSVPTYSHTTSPDGLLRPPAISQPRSQGRSRRSSVPTLRSTTPDSGHDMRSIPTANSNFSASNGITTSILIPKMMPRYDLELERDLADYSHALGSMDPQPSEASKSSPPASSDNETGFGFLGGEDEPDLPPGFDFDAEFGDIIDIHASRERQN